jgi:hypothetical protein
VRTTHSCIPSRAAAGGQARLEHATDLRLADAEDAGDLAHSERRAGPLSSYDRLVQ